ncbi:hypothetical protein Ddye_028819 [Dipteronia dyeriana]|uniref:Uncharacterized protein n=1 Tax=Dipteronia dyeriana TaxID=168575 RepID=A0AAD9TDG4_9ROSI|nr:hypothetical protein Ddye_028819 [Dipteronia dyeriana]
MVLKLATNITKDDLVYANNSNKTFVYGNVMRSLGKDIVGYLKRPTVANGDLNKTYKGKGLLTKNWVRKPSGSFIQNGKIVLDKVNNHNAVRVWDSDDSGSTLSEERDVGQLSSFPIMRGEASFIDLAKLKGGNIVIDLGNEEKKVVKKISSMKRQCMKFSKTRSSIPQDVGRIRSGSPGTRGLKKRWNLEEEVAKIVEKGKVLGYFNDSYPGMENMKDSIVGVAFKTGSWSLSEEVAKVIEIEVAFGFDFDGRENEESKLILFDFRVVKSLGGLLLTKGVRVDANGLAGGLVTLWNEVFFEVKTCITNEICIILSGMLTKLMREVVYCNVYGANYENERIELWRFILQAQVSLLGPWVIRGDFNIVLEHWERKGGGGNVRSMRNFKMFIDLAKVIDIPMVGIKFTWSNNGENKSWTRLDQFHCDLLFLSWFPNLVQKGLNKSLSDHNPVCIGEPVVDWGPRPFKFLNCWLEKELMKGVRNTWKQSKGNGSTSSNLFFKIKAVEHHMKAWSKGRKSVGDQ